MKLYDSRFVRRPAIWILFVLGLAVLSGLAVGSCGTLPPIPPDPVTAAPTITQVAEITPLPATHIPTRTLTPIPPTETAAWTPTYFPSSTATSTETSSPTRTEKPSSSPGPTASATPTLPNIVMPNSGGSADVLTRIAETATPTATATDQPTATPVPEIEPPPLPVCAVKWKVVYYHWEAGEWTMKLRCPLEGTPVTPGAGL